MGPFTFAAGYPWLFFKPHSPLNNSLVAECWAASCGIAVNYARKVR